jgi:uridine phosphorylase
MACIGELSDDFYSEKSVLTAKDLVNWKKAKGHYNFLSLPETVLIVLDKQTVKHHVGIFDKRIKGIKGFNYIRKKSLLICSEFGSGAPAIISLMEELKELGVNKYLFIGIAGILSPSTKENCAFAISETYSSLGCSKFYSKDELFQPVDQSWFEYLKTNLNIDSSTCWSTDAPFRETKSLIKKFTDKGAELVEMECASIYAFSNFYNLPSMCILFTADKLYNNRWEPPTNMSLLNSTQNELISMLIILLSKN